MTAINYAQCWEDPVVLRRALSIRADDDVISIGSGGDNTLALLLDAPRSVTAVDMNPAQLHLLELKMKAIQTFEYEDVIRFIGIRPCKQRMHLYRQLRGRLTDHCSRFWDSNRLSLEHGIIHQGKFERYLRAFRAHVLPSIQSGDTVRRLLASSSIEEQREIYRVHWDSYKWRLLFRLFFSRAVLGTLGRDRTHFRYVDQRGVAGELMRRTCRGLTEIPVRNNYYLHYILTGRYRNAVSAPPYLQPTNFLTLRNRIPCIELHCGELTSFLRTHTRESFSRFNLSDVLEYMSPGEVEAFLAELIRTSRPEGRAAFWTLFVPREVPQNQARQILDDKSRQQELRSIDRGFFYGSFHLWHLKPSPTTKQLAPECPADHERRTANA